MKINFTLPDGRFLPVYHVRDAYHETEPELFLVDLERFPNWQEMEDHEIFECYKLDDQGNIIEKAPLEGKRGLFLSESYKIVS